MADAGFFRGTSADQDNRFSDKEKKLLKSMKFEDILSTKIDMKKVKMEVLKPWITKRTTELLKMEDDVVVEFIFNQLEDQENPDPRKMQINLTGFLNGKYARVFMGELWTMLDSAQKSETGIPAELLNTKMEELKERKTEDTKLKESLRKLADSMGAEAERKEKEDEEEERRRDRRRSRSREPRDRRDRRRSRSRDRGGERRRSRERGERRSARKSPEPASNGGSNGKAAEEKTAKKVC